MLRFGQRAHVQLRRTLCNSTTVTGVSLSQPDRLVTVSIPKDTKTKLQFPLAWLRDNCQCPVCYSSTSTLRNLKMLDFNPRVGATSAELSVDHGALSVTWEDGHSSSYRLDWLRSVAFDADSAGRQRLPPSRHRPLLWCDDGSPPFARPERLDFAELMRSDSTLLTALLELERRGLVLLQGSGLDPGAVKRLCERLAFPRTTHYGEMFEMRTEAKPRNLGYTTERLDYHTDLPYLHEQPGVQALLCLRQAPDPGGDSLFADGFSAAELVRRRRPDLFRLLVDVPVRFRDRSATAGQQRGFDLVASHPTVELAEAGTDAAAEAGQYRRVHFSNQQRDRLQSWPLAQVQSIYDALKAFNEAVEGPDGEAADDGGVRLRVKLQPGEMALFDNSRLLHSRTAFAGERHLAGAYLLWDEVLSRRRTLEAAATAAAADD